MKSILKVLTTFSIFLKLVKWKVLLLIFSILSTHRNEKNIHYSQIFIKIRIFSSDEFPCKTEFSFFFLTGISNNLLVGNYKEKLRHEANFRGGGNRGKKKNVEITGWKFPGKYSCKGSPRPIKKADESGCTSFLGKEISNTSRSPPCAKNASVPPLFSRSTI